MLLIKDVIKDMKCDLKYAQKNIQKAIRYKMDNPMLAEEYYKRSVGNIDDMMGLHDDVVKIITDYRKTKGDPPRIMTEMWDFSHEDLMEDVVEIKQYQEHYKSL